MSFEIGKEAFDLLSTEQRQQKIDALPYADKKMAAMLVKRDNFNLADALTPLTGKGVAHTSVAWASWAWVSKLPRQF